MWYLVSRIWYKNSKWLRNLVHTKYDIQDTKYFYSRGVTVMLVIAFMGVFALLVGTVTSFVFQQGKYGRALHAREQALHIAEAGLEYYRWFLAHNPAIMQSGVGLVSPYTHVVNDPEASRVGESVVTASASLQCGSVQWVDLSARGTADSATGYPRTLSARYMKQSVAEYSYLLNTNVWAGADRNIVGPYHSNGGIRMDGTNNSDVTSAVTSWTCDGSFGCNPTQSKPGVFGDGSGSLLWQFPVSTINFTGIASDFPALRSKAQASGILLASTTVRVGNVQQGSSFSSVGGSDQRGFRLVFNSNNTVSVYRVTGTSYAWSIHHDNLNQWVRDYHTITAQTLHGTYAVPSGCSLIYSDTKLWIEGTIAGKVTIVASDAGSFMPDIILSGNIGYTSVDGSIGLTAVAERSVLIPLMSPDNMSLRGIFVAQSGYFGRNLYDCAYSPNHVRSTLTINGTIVSNQRTGTKWSYGWCGGNATSGYQTRTDAYDRLLAFSPPPFTPAASTDYRLMLWREQ